MAYRLGINIDTTDTVASVDVDGAPVPLVSLGACSQQTHSAVFPADAPHPGKTRQVRIRRGRTHLTAPAIHRWHLRPSPTVQAAARAVQAVTLQDRVVKDQVGPVASWSRSSREPWC